MEVQREIVTRDMCIIQWICNGYGKGGIILGQED